MFWFYALGLFVFLSIGFFFILNGKQKYAHTTDIK
jgi:hypothetical protein